MGSVIITHPKPFVYVAGPISRDPLGAVRNSLRAWHDVRDAGAWPFMPQWSIVVDMIQHNDYEEYMSYDFDFIRRADALVRLEGESPGADREVEYAKLLKIPVFYHHHPVEDQSSWLTFCTWVVDWKVKYAATPSH